MTLSAQGETEGKASPAGGGAAPGAGEAELGEATGAAHLPSLNFLDPAKLHFVRPAPSRPVRLTVEGDRTYLRISARAAFPLTDRGHHVELYDEKDKSIGIIRSTAELPEAERAVLASEIDRRYFTPVITRIDRVKREFGFHRFQVETDRGARDFLVRSIREDVDILDRSRYRIKDTDGRFYEIPDARALPAASRRMLDQLF